MIPSMYVQLPILPGDLAWVPKNIFPGGNVDVSKNNGTTKSSILMGFSIINHPFLGTIIFGNTHVVKFFPWLKKTKEHRIVMGISEPPNCPPDFLRSVCPPKILGFLFDIRNSSIARPKKLPSKFEKKTSGRRWAFVCWWLKDSKSFMSHHCPSSILTCSQPLQPGGICHGLCQIAPGGGSENQRVWGWNHFTKKSPETSWETLVHHS